MTVYIEYAFIDNMIINFILVRTAVRLARIKSSWIYQLISALIGTLVAIVTPLFSLSQVFAVVVKITLAFLMVYVSGKFSSIKKYLFTVLTFIILTFLSGGFIIALFNLLNVDYETYFILNYDSVLPIGLSVLIIYVLSNTLVKLATNFIKERNLRPFLRNCVAIVNKKKIKLRGFIDSGNSLYDRRSGLPVNVCSDALFKKLKDCNVKKSVSKLTFDTVSGSSQMELYVIDKLLIYNGTTVNIFNNVLIGVSKYGFSSLDYELLLHPDMC